jgi:hypothetical protein
LAVGVDASTISSVAQLTADEDLLMLLKMMMTTMKMMIRELNSSLED